MSLISVAVPPTTAAASAWEYYQRGRDHYILHPNTRALLEKMLILVRDEGEDKALAIIRREILHR